MDIKVRSRDAGYCNLKLLLIFLVVYGHLIEPYIDENNILAEIYRWIYLVHMPLFAFLSGMFLKGKANSLRQMKRAFLYYILIQTAVVCAIKTGGKEPVIWGKPYWHLWYLLSLTYWAAAAFLWNCLVKRFPKISHRFVKVLLTAAAVWAACMAGGVPEINRMYSLSRSLVFFPYVLAGLFCPADISWNRYRLIGAAALAAAVCIYRWSGAKIPVSFLYQASSYGRISMQEGVQMRLVCYLLGGCLGMTLLTWIPQKRFPWSKAGANTMGIYICHAVVIKMIWQMEFSAESILYFGAAAAGLIVWFFFKIFQWNVQQFAIIETCRYRERKQTKKGCGTVQDFRVRG